MNASQFRAYVLTFTNAVDALIELEGMKAENLNRDHHNQAPAYTEEAFEQLRKQRRTHPDYQREHWQDHGIE